MVILALPMKFTQKISPKSFIISHILIFFFGLIFLGVIYYIVNVQYIHSTDPFSNGPVTSRPKSFTLNLDQPDDESLSFNPAILISGRTGPNMDVLISTDNDDQVIEAKSDGSFSLTVNLDEGVNNIKVVSFDSTGDTRETTRLVYFSKEKLQ